MVSLRHPVFPEEQKGEEGFDLLGGSFAVTPMIVLQVYTTAEHVEITQTKHAQSFFSNLVTLGVAGLQPAKVPASLYIVREPDDRGWCVRAAGRENLRNHECKRYNYWYRALHYGTQAVCGFANKSVFSAIRH